MTTKCKRKRIKTTMHMGIAIPDGTDQDGVSLLKAALIATAHDSAISLSNRRVLDKESEFIVNVSPSPNQVKEHGLDADMIASHAMIEASIVVEYDRPEPLPFPEIDDN